MKNHNNLGKLTPDAAATDLNNISNNLNFSKGPAWDESPSPAGQCLFHLRDEKGPMQGPLSSSCMVAGDHAARDLFHLRDEKGTKRLPLEGEVGDAWTSHARVSEPSSLFKRNEPISSFYLVAESPISAIKKANKVKSKTQFKKLRVGFNIDNKYLLTVKPVELLPNQLVKSDGLAVPFIFFLLSATSQLLIKMGWCPQVGVNSIKKK